MTDEDYELATYLRDERVEINNFLLALRQATMVDAEVSMTCWELVKAFMGTKGTVYYRGKARLTSKVIPYLIDFFQNKLNEVDKQIKEL